MLARAEHTLPTRDYAFEVKWDGFRAIVSTKNGFRARSRRGWDMTPLIPELARDDVHGVFDSELVAFDDGVPHFPLVGARMLHGKRHVPVAFAAFDVLALDGSSTTNLPYREAARPTRVARARRRLSRRCAWMSRTDMPRA